MQIKTKFNCGETVFTIDPKNLKVFSFVIDSIIVHLWKGKVSTSIYPKDGTTSYNEDNCFSTKEELIKHIAE